MSAWSQAVAFCTRACVCSHEKTNQAKTRRGHIRGAQVGFPTHERVSTCAECARSRLPASAQLNTRSSAVSPYHDVLPPLCLITSLWLYMCRHTSTMPLIRIAFLAACTHACARMHTRMHARMHICAHMCTHAHAVLSFSMILDLGLLGLLACLHLGHMHLHATPRTRLLKRILPAT